MNLPHTTIKDQNNSINGSSGEPRQVEQIITSQSTSDGAGVRLKRSIGSHLLAHLDPFLLLDEFRSDNSNDYIAGFPSHPHRGFETVTYMLAGSMEHKDSRGNQGVLKTGCVQWMTAARGIVHSEMPIQENGLMWGFQLWVNLPAKDKMKQSNYQDINSQDIPEVILENGIRIRIIAGESQGVLGAVRGVAVDPLYLDIFMPENTFFNQPVAKDHSSFVYVFEGKIEVGATKHQAGQLIHKGQLAVLSDGQVINAQSVDASARFLLIAGKPLNEPIVKYGPFVMNTEEEIEQAIHDFRKGKFID